MIDFPCLARNDRYPLKTSGRSVGWTFQKAGLKQSNVKAIKPGPNLRRKENNTTVSLVVKQTIFNDIANESDTLDTFSFYQK